MAISYGQYNICGEKGKYEEGWKNVEGEGNGVGEKEGEENGKK